MGLGCKKLVFILGLIGCASTVAAREFDPSPWLADLEQVRRALHEKYANLDWAETERELPIDPLLLDSARRLGRATNDREARAVFERIERKIGDGHLTFEWPPNLEPARAPAAAPAAAADNCGKIGYDARQTRPGTAQAMRGYVPLQTSRNPFDAGTIDIDGTRVGVVRIAVFQPHGYPELCHAAFRALSIRRDQPCDVRCQDRVVTWAYRRLTESLQDRVVQLKSKGAQVLMVDISDNGGGSEWAEAAARIFSAKQLVSGRRGFVRGDHWAKQWRDLGEKLREYAVNADAADKARLLAWARQSDLAMVQAQMPCPRGSRSCARIATGGYSTGLVGAAPSGAFDGKEWGVYVFSPAQFPYRDGVWSGPLLVLVDQETWSAAEEFAAILQDNKAAVVIGARTGGAGCGHTYGGTPTKLQHSGAILKLPDCVRFRADGSNEVRGIIPDEVIGLRASDGATLRAELMLEKLPAAIDKARKLNGR